MDSNDLAFLSAYSQILQFAQNNACSQGHFQYLVSDLMKKYTQFLIHQHPEFSQFQLLANDIHLNNDNFRVVEC